MMLMVNNKEIMGKYTNNKVKNIIGWATIAILIVLTAILTFEPMVKALLR
jgi:Mn2+/Fe2+ NRAMP family transporter